MNDRDNDRSRSSRLRFPSRLAALGLMAVAPMACVSEDPPPVDPLALQRIEREGAAGTRYERLDPLTSREYYLNPRDRNDPRKETAINRHSGTPPLDRSSSQRFRHDGVRCTRDSPMVSV